MTNESFNSSFSFDSLAYNYNNIKREADLDDKTIYQVFDTNITFPVFHPIVFNGPIQSKNGIIAGEQRPLSSFKVPKIYRINNSVVKYPGTFMYNHSYYRFYDKCLLNDSFSTHLQFTQDLHKYESLIIFGHHYPFAFGHFFLEFLPQLYFIPEHIRKVSKVMIGCCIEECGRLFSLVNISRHQVVQSNSQFFFAKRLYIVNTELCCASNPYLLLSFRNYLVQRFNLDSKPPTRFILYNRKNYIRRNIQNYDELFNAVKSKFPQFPWECHQTSPTVEEELHYWNSVKFLFAVHGSIEANSLIMQPNTIIAEVGIGSMPNSFVYPTVYTGKHYCIHVNKAIKLQEKKKVVLDIDEVISHIETALKAGQLL